jgi:hypothetical protein
MTKDFVKIHDAISDLIKSFEQKNVIVKMQSDLDSNTIKIYGETASVLERAKGGLEEVAELAFATAEHHPYWNLLYSGSQILKIVLEKWHDTLSTDEIKEINWYVDEIKNSLSNLSTDHRK